MNGDTRRRLTFAALDREKGIPDPLPATSQEYPLPTWYREVREKPLDELGVEDICKACRQQIHLDYVVPVSLRHLQAGPLAGEMFDGELLASLKSIPPDYWIFHSEQAQILKNICEEVQTQPNVSGDVQQDVAFLLAMITKQPNLD